jgi:hypothetical protein
MEYVELPHRSYREVVEDLLERRGIKNRLGMLVWLRDQKAKKADANRKRMEKAIREMDILTELIEKEEGGAAAEASDVPIEMRKGE